MIRLAIVCFALCSTSYADDVYLKTGFVVRNVQVIDTTNGQMSIQRDGQKIAVAIEDVLRVEHFDMLPNQKSTYELFSRDLYEQHLKSLPEREKIVRQRREQLKAAQTASMADSLQKTEEHLDSVYPWRKSLYLAGGWGIPQGFRFEFGYNLGTSLALGVSFGIGDTWSLDPQEGTVAILGSIRFPLQSSRVTPYLLICTGGTIKVMGADSDTYTLLYAGAIVSVKPWLQLRPELGIAFTTKRTSGYTSYSYPFNVPTTIPDVEEANTRFGAHLTVEIDFRQLF